jgi:hypothetical protein
VEVTAARLADTRHRARYDLLFEACPRAFVQQSTWWAEAIAPLGPDEPILVLCADAGEDVAGLPLYLYRHPLGNLLTSVPQAGPLGGIFTRPDLDDERRDAAHRALGEAALALGREHDCLALTLITDPLAKDDLERYRRWLEPTYVLENFTQLVHLDQPARRSHGHRNNLNRARKAGYTASFAEGLDELRAWHVLHRERHTDLGVAPLDLGLFESLFRSLWPRDKAQLLLVRAGDEIVSGGLYVYHRDVVDVFMLSGASSRLAGGPNFVNTDRSLDWAQKMGALVYNWQGSQSRVSGVYAYKAQWGSVEAPYYFLTRLLAPRERLATIGLAALRAAYAGHYVVPYAVFDQGLDTAYFRKGDLVMTLMATVSV